MLSQFQRVATLLVLTLTLILLGGCGDIKDAPIKDAPVKVQPVPVPVKDALLPKGATKDDIETGLNKNPPGPDGGSMK